MSQLHYVVWIDREHARIFNLSSQARIATLSFDKPDHHSHRKTHEDVESPKFYHDVAQHLKDAGSILVVGPGVGKAHFRSHLEAHDPAVAKKVIGYETADHPTDGELQDFARRYFDQPLLWGV